MNPIQKALAQADAIIAQDIALDATLNGTKPVPTFAQLAEATLDDVLQVIPAAQARGAVIERTTVGDIIVFTDQRLFFIQGTHVSVREFMTAPMEFNIAAAKAGMSR